jgi:diguanylate cyclase
MIESMNTPQSAEILRITLPLMSKYKIPVTPHNYAVWYEYASGKNLLLNQKIDAVIKAGDIIDDEFVRTLHAEYIDHHQELNQLEKAQKTFAVLHENLTAVLKAALVHTTRYGKTLDEYNDRITSNPDLQQIQLLIDEISLSTGAVLNNNQELMEDFKQKRSEVTLLHQQLQIAKKEAITDALTQLPNRKAFFDAFENLSAQGLFDIGDHCLLMLDIDNFKKVNDSYGHLFGDKVIKAVANAVRSNTKGKDIAARFGGEEFIVFLPDTNRAGAQVVAEIIRKTIASSQIINPRNGKIINSVTVSIGLAQFSPGDRLEAVIGRADDALHQAKKAGRNRTIFDHL